MLQAFPKLERVERFLKLCPKIGEMCGFVHLRPRNALLCRHFHPANDRCPTVADGDVLLHLRWAAAAIALVSISVIHAIPFFATCRIFAFAGAVIHPKTAAV